MPALAELSPGVSRNGHLVSINCGYFDFRAMQKKVQFPDSLRTIAGYSIR